MLLQFFIVLIILSLGMYLSIRAGKLTVAGAFTGGLLGIFIFLGAGFTGLAMLALFFILGTTASGWKLNYKISLGLAEENKGRRTAGQAFANAGVAGILGLLACLFPKHADLFNFMLGASFASATADTLSSELGNIYGSRYFNILTWKPDMKGENGVISWEGTLLGILGSILIAFLYGVGFGFNLSILGIILAGTIGNLADSVLGATLERQNQINNDVVNFLNTLIAALAGLALYFIN